MAGVGTADVPAASGISYRAAVPSGVPTGIYMVLEMRDGDKGNLRDKGILKAMVNIIDITGKPTDKFMVSVLYFNVISGGSHAENCLACPEFSSVPTGAGNVAEDMITATEVYHTLKFGHQAHVLRGVCNVGDETHVAPSVQLNIETLDFITESLELDQSVFPRFE